MDTEIRELNELDEQWLEVDGIPLINWDSPKVIEGTYQGATEAAGKFGFAKRHEIVIDGTPYRFFAPAVLERLLTDRRIRVGRSIESSVSAPRRRRVPGAASRNFVCKSARNVMVRPR